MLGSSNSGRTTASPASGPNAWAVATPRLSSTTGEGLIWASPSYSATMRGQSVSSATRARAWQAAIAACSAYGPVVPPELLDPLDAGEPAADQRLVPTGAVLVEQQHRLAVRAGAGVEARRLDLDQGQQPQRLGVVRGQPGQHPAQPQRLGAQVGARPLAPAGRRVALVEDQVHDLAYGVQPGRALLRPGQLEPDVRGGQGPLGPDDALGDRRLGRQEGAGDVLGAEAAHQLQGERGAGVRRQDRVAGHEDQPEQVLGQVAVDDLVEVVLQALRGGRGHLAVLAPLGVAPADPVDGQEVRGPVQPGRRVVRHPVLAPLLDRRDEGVLGQLLGGVQVADEAGEPSDDARRLDRHRVARVWSSACRPGAVRQGLRTRPRGVRRPAPSRPAARTCGRARPPRPASRPRGSRSPRSAPSPRRTGRR